ncbi:MAG: hypothetical protein RLZZ488_2180 [Pseudomonadota bacterium]
MTRAFLAILPLTVALGCNIKKNSSESQVSKAGGSRTSFVTLAEVQDAVTKIVNQNPNEVADLFSFTGNCVAVSDSWTHKFKANTKFPVYQGSISGTMFVNVGGKKQLRDANHTFILFNPGRRNEIIFDPTYGQFILDAPEISGLPRMLLKPTAEAPSIYFKHSKNLRIFTTLTDDATGHYNPAEFTEFLYGFGRYSKNRMVVGPL